MEAHSQNPNPNPNPQSMRVLIRPSPPQIPPPSPPPLPNPPDPSPPSTSSQSSPNGIVVVGFIGKRRDDVTQLINRIIDANVFGSGNLDTPFRFGKEDLMSEEIQEWFKLRSISFYFEEEKGILYLQFSSIMCPVMEESLESRLGFDSGFEDCEFGDLQGWLFMFSVCHVVILIQEGSHFDTQFLKKFRVLQSSKNALSPYLKSHIVQPSNIHVSSSLRMPTSLASSNSPSSGRSRSILNRGGGSVILMSGLGSYSSLLPGQCNPVILFVFLDDFMDANFNTGIGQQVEAPTLSQLSTNNMARPNLSTKGSGSVVVLARPANKTEGGFRKKLQSSLEGQIRFLIKKCRVLSSSETGHVGSRSGGLSSSAPLFLLDASKAVALVDSSSNSRGSSLEFATSLVENVLAGKATSDSLLLESNSESTNKEDILSVKEFISRQCDILRGRGSSSSGPAAGAGMVAVAAAAAAASASSGKTFSAPDLPSLDSWISSSQPILYGILNVKAGSEGETDFRKEHQQNVILPADEGISSKVADSAKMAISFLENGMNLSSKFSTLWCEKALPVARELYLKELPPCYPSPQHKAHLERALFALKSMVKGPAVQLYLKKLEEECTSIWMSGRQLCDAVSLTGKPCMHKRHDLESDALLSRDSINQHSSGYVFLHACACGRSRQLRSDPFDFETANITFNVFPECDKLLPALEVPQNGASGPIKPSCWSLVRIGGAKYYNPAKGLLQSGFVATQKFLLKWTIFLGKYNTVNDSSLNGLTEGFPMKIVGSNKGEFVAEKDTKKTDDTHQSHVPSEVDSQNRRSLVTMKADDQIASSGRRISSSTMKKPFSEVVAGSAGTNSAFPPLQTRKPVMVAEKGIKQHGVKENGSEMNLATRQGSQKVHDNDGNRVHAANGGAVSVKGMTNVDPVLKIDNDGDPVNMIFRGMTKGFTSPKHVVMYVGFEHECPNGHRFILSPDHLKDLGSSYAAPEESPVSLPIDNSDHKAADSAKFSKNGGFKNRKQSNGTNNAVVRTMNILEDSKVREQTPSEKVSSSVMDLGGKLESVNVDEGSALSLLNRNLPIYMNCPHCRASRRKKDSGNVKFAGSISQLQRIFLVTPAFPVVLAACPVVQFEESCLPSAVPDHNQKLQFGLGCQVILPPESFLSLRLPFVYGIELEDGKLHPLTPLGDQPHLTAWINKGTTLQILSEGSGFKQGSST
ncbi:OLC1v1003768C2 [Oldenlandia corymbosa var. corymbosa]|uniref:Nonsense-mediated mRNA decay factor SMG8 n=1 Tax=Oldenlandia corymbosa var. corymbosa TaxID=529605 RepID=A0AAV1DBE1_OLDCO|nr:OLC1v1003768C2 [Oldenlandia corymbosa var. corymbosa]